MAENLIKFLLGEKIGMTQILKEERAFPVTIIKAGPCVVTDIKLKENNGYTAIQLGFQWSGRKRIPKPVAGQLKDLNIDIKPTVLKEFRIPEDVDLPYKRGDVLNVNVFKVGELVNISGLTKAKGFQGVVKRHGFKDGPRTHGQKDRYRHPGSIGGTNPQKVIKGLRMAGRMGPRRITVKNLEIIDILPEENILVVKGSVPGKKNSILEIRSSTLTNKGRVVITPKVEKYLLRLTK